MCLTCGCGQAHKRMGSNITYEDVREIAEENNKSVEETLRVMADTAQKDRSTHREEYDKPWQAAPRA